MPTTVVSRLTLSNAAAASTTRRPPAVTARCNMFSKNVNGATRQAKFANRTGTGWMTVPDITNACSYCAYDMVCYLPPKGGIATIYIEERG